MNAQIVVIVDCLHDRQVLQIDPDATDDELKKRFRAVSTEEEKNLSFFFYVKACRLGPMG